jgi:alpha-glucosidase
MKRSQIVLIFLIAISSSAFAQKETALLSPSGNIKVTIRVADSIYYSVDVNGRQTISPSTLSLITAEKPLGIQSRVLKQARRSVNENIVNPVPHKRKIIPDKFNELAISFREKFSVVFRAYDDGIAYRFETSFSDSIQVNDEVANFRFDPKSTVYFPQIQKRGDLDIYHTSFEEPYLKLPLSDITNAQVGFSPVLVDDGTIKSVITESDLFDYPGMFLTGKKSNVLKGVFAPYPDKERVQDGEFRQWVVVSRKNFIARTKGTRTFPWRVVALADKDADLLMNDLVYRLATPPSTQDWSWIKPGISTEEWIIGSNLHGVGFKAGFNTETYKYYIDFASRFGLQYVMLDAGWSDNNDLFKRTPGLDLEELSAYAKTKNISLILWTLSMTLDRQLEPALDMFNRLGVKAILIDFMDRDDQKTVNFYKKIAEATARHKIMVMYHGAFKNAGFERTFPNAITREAILGSEYNMWSEKCNPEHDLLIPFIRMISGPLDYEPGFYRNANQRTFRALPDMIMSQGTRTHQLAMFVVYESPLQLFAGNPSDAYGEVGFTTYLASMHTTWDDLKVLDAKLGDYLVLARKKDNDWYLAALTDWTPRELTVDLSFLDDGKYRALSCADGINAEKDASDYSLGYELIDRNKKLNIKMAPGGGYVVKLIKLNDARP